MFEMTKTEPERRRYVTAICESLVNSYGSTIVEYGADVRIADTVVKDLVENFKDVGINTLPSCSPMSAAEFKEWRKHFLNDLGYQSDD